jgi:hypothetical protein
MSQGTVPRFAAAFRSKHQSGGWRREGSLAGANDRPPRKAFRACLRAVK